MLEHINDIKHDDLVKVFHEISGIESSSAYKFLSTQIYNVESSHRNDEGVSYNVRIKVDNMFHIVHLTRRLNERDSALDLRLCLFYFYPDGWIDLPD